MLRLILLIAAGLLFWTSPLVRVLALIYSAQRQTSSNRKTPTKSDRRFRRPWIN